MVHALDDERALQLARDAHKLLNAGQRQAASRRLREAMLLSPKNTEVQAAFEQIARQDELNHPLSDLLRRYVTDRDEDAGRQAATYLSSPPENTPPPPQDVLIDGLNLILSVPASKLSPLQDDILTSLVRSSIHVRRHLAAELQNSVTRLFDDLYDRGDGIVRMLVHLILDPALWPDDTQRVHCENELFVLFVAKLLESGYDLHGRSVSGLARLLAVHAEYLHSSLDEEGIDAIIAGLDIRLPSEVRGQATIVLAKYLEVAKEAGQEIFKRRLVGRLEENKDKRRRSEYIVCFSALATMYPVVPTVCATIFLNDPQIRKTLSDLTDPRQRPGDEMLAAILTLFNATLIDRASREAVYKDYADWLGHLVSNARDERVNSLAALTLTKLRATGSDAPNTANTAGSGNEASRSAVVEEDEGSTHDLVDRFTKLLGTGGSSDIGKSTDGTVVSAAPDLQIPIEGLAYSSVHPEVKEQLIDDSPFSSNLVKVLRQQVADPSLTTATPAGKRRPSATTELSHARSPTSSSIVYGGLTILWNLTRYRPNLTEEQKKIAQLKAYANVSRPAQQDAIEVLDDEDHVRRRCDAVVEAGVMGLLMDLWKHGAGGVLGDNKGWFILTPTVKDLIAKIMLSISRNPKTRGKLAQQGAVRLLVSMLGDDSAGNGKSDAKGAALPPTSGAGPGPLPVSGESTMPVAAHALARLLISLDPTLVFPASGFPQITSAIRPLVKWLLEPLSASNQAGFGPGSMAANDNQPRDLLPVFEGLLALTNLAAYPDARAADAISRLAWSDVYQEAGEEGKEGKGGSKKSEGSDVLDDLLLHSNPRIQRAACELVCNLVSAASPELGIGRFVDADTTSTPTSTTTAPSYKKRRHAQRTHVLLALTDAHDQATRRAAGGALATLTGVTGVVEAVLARERGVELVLGMCVDDGESSDDSEEGGSQEQQQQRGAGDVGLVHRGLVCMQNMCETQGETGKRAIEAFKRADAARRLAERLQKGDIMAQPVLEAGVSVLKMLV